MSQTQSTYHVLVKLFEMLEMADDVIECILQMRKDRSTQAPNFHVILVIPWGGANQLHALCSASILLSNSVKYSSVKSSWPSLPSLPVFPSSDLSPTLLIFCSVHQSTILYPTTRFCSIYSITKAKSSCPHLPMPEEVLSYSPCM